MKDFIPLPYNISQQQDQTNYYWLIKQLIDDLQYKMLKIRYYQHDKTWSKLDHGRFIDSIMKKSYVIPPIVVFPSSKRSTYEVLDGGSRLRSLKYFVKGLIPQVDEKNKRFVWFKQCDDIEQFIDSDTKGYENLRIDPKLFQNMILPDDLAKNFLRQTLHVICILNLSEDDKYEVYNRLSATLGYERV